MNLNRDNSQNLYESIYAMDLSINSINLSIDTQCTLSTCLLIQWPSLLIQWLSQLIEIIDYGFNKLVY